MIPQPTGKGSYECYIQAPKIILMPDSWGRQLPEYRGGELTMSALLFRL